MSELGDAVTSVRRTASRVKTGTGKILTKLIIVSGLAGWVLFWSMLVRFHYSIGDYVSAVFTTVVFLGPGVAVLTWYLTETLGFDLSLPTGDGNILST